MTAKQLTDSILQLAIQGKLVPQNPDDEPASVLLDRIREEKKRLVKEGKLKKKDLVETPINEDEIPFDIPESWEWVSLDFLSKRIHYGYTASASTTGNVKLLRITDIQDDKVNWGTVPYCTIKDKDKESYCLQNRDILIARTGGTVGKTYIVRELKDNAVFASYLIRVVPLDIVNEEYLKLFMASPYYWAQLTDATTGTGQPNVNGQSLSKLIIPLPPPKEQERILKKYSECQPLINEYGAANDELEKMNAELPEKLKKSILQEAIMGKLGTQDPNDEPASVLLDRIREEKKQLVKAGVLKKKDLVETPIDEDDKPFDIPESWEWCRLSSLIYLVCGTSYQKGDVCNKGIRIIRGGNIVNDELFLDSDDVFVPMNYKDSAKNIQMNDIVIVGSTGSLKVIGKPAIITNPIENCQIGAFLRIIRAINHDVMPFVHKIFISGFYRDYISDLVQGTNIFNIRSEYIEDMLVPIPPLSEQHRIVEKIEALFAEVDHMEI